MASREGIMVHVEPEKKGSSSLNCRQATIPTFSELCLMSGETRKIDAFFPLARLVTLFNLAESVSLFFYFHFLAASSPKRFSEFKLHLAEWIVIKKSIMHLREFVKLYIRRYCSE